MFGRTHDTCRGGSPRIPQRLVGQTHERPNLWRKRASRWRGCCVGDWLWMSGHSGVSFGARTRPEDSSGVASPAPELIGVSPAPGLTWDGMLEIGGSGATASEEGGRALPGSDRLRGRSSTVSAIGGGTFEYELDPSSLLARRASCAGEWLTQPQPEALRSAQPATNLKVTRALLMS
jgi:hypothetical protein